MEPLLFAAMVVTSYLEVEVLFTTKRKILDIKKNGKAN